MRALPPTVVFSRCDALALGWTDSALQRAMRAGRVTALRRGHYTAGASTPELRAIAVARACPGAVIGHRSALLAAGLPIVGARLIFPELTVPPRGRVDVPGAHMYRARLPSEHVTQLAGTAITTVPRTLVDVARRRTTVCAVAAIDAALHRGLTNPDELAAVLRFCWNWPGIRRAHRAVLLSDARTESPLESVSRLAFGWLGLPRPEPQTVILGELGQFLGRPVFYWDEFGVFGEADGAVKYSDANAFPAEKKRHERLEDAGLVGVRWTWTDVTRQPNDMKARIERAFERGRRRDGSGFPRLWSVRAAPAAHGAVKAAI